MAREEHDREDLLREATGLSERIELELVDYPQPVVVGFRDSGSTSIYFGADPVFQFNSQDQLRRAHVEGLLYKAERKSLVALRRVRTTQATSLVRSELDADETALFMSAMTRQLSQLLENLLAEKYRVVGQVPEDRPIVDRVIERLPALLGAEIATSARAS